VQMQNEFVDLLSQLTLFADLSRPQLEAVAHTFEEEWFSEGQRIVRQGFTGSGFYVIVEGEAAVNVDGEQRARLGRGEFFGEISVLLGEAPTADVVAVGPLRCLVLGGPELEGLLLAYPRMMLRMLMTESRRVRNANLWRSQ
jgi:CRP-like cAMP-binding protein